MILEGQALSQLLTAAASVVIIRAAIKYRPWRLIARAFRRG